MKPLSTPKLTRRAIVILFTAIAVLYIGFHSRYMAEYLDDAWILSWAWNLHEHAEIRDIVFGEQNSGGQFFQRTVIVLYGAIASLLGWTRGVGHAVSKMFVIATAACWFFIIQKLGYRKSSSWAFAGIMLLLEAYFGIANKIRPEPLALFLCSLSFLLFLSNRDFFAGLLLGIAVESHPFAYIGGFWVLAYLVVLRPQMKSSPRKYILRGLIYTAGLMLGFGYWMVLHGKEIGELSSLVNRIGSNVFEAYYISHRYTWRHWPELIVTVLATVWFIAKHKYRTHPFALPFMISVIMAAFIMPRGNIHYIVYIYPAAILMILIVAEELKIVPYLVFSLLLFQLPQYTWLFWHQRHYNHQEFLTRLNEFIPEDSALIYGNPNAWFGLQKHEFRGYGFFKRAGITPDKWPENMIIIETSDFQRWGGAADLARGIHLYKRHDITEWTNWDGKSLEIYRLVKVTESS